MVILGWYGSRNTGDEAVLEAVAGALRERGVTDLHVLSIDPQVTARKLRTGSSPRSLLNLDTFRALRHARALVLGGGGLIQDRTSVYNLPIYALFVLLARLSGARVIGWGLGVEPLDTLLGRMLARFICTASDYFSVRDEVSKRLLVSAGVPRTAVIVSADPAFLLPREMSESQLLPSAEPTAVFCLRDLPDNRPGLNLHYLLPISVRRRIGLGGGANTERTGRFVEACARAVRLCVTEFGLSVRFVSLWPERDDHIARRVIAEAERMGVPPSSMSLPEGGLTPAAVAAQIEIAHLLVSMRLHALVFAARAGVPMMALAYARKVRGLMRGLGAERWVVEVETRLPPPEEMEMKLRLLWDSRSAVGEESHRNAAAARQRAERDADDIASLLASALQSARLS